MSDRIAQIFSQKTVLITGATFISKLIVEKILRCCPNVDKIHILLDSTLKNLTDDPLFETLKIQQGFEIFNKVVPIAADMSHPELNLNVSKRHEICKNVQIIFHCASIDSDLKKTILTNVRGTKLLLELAKQCKKLEIFSYISTIYCQLDEEIVHEKIYQRPENAQRIMRICEILDDDMLILIKHKILGNFPNSYIFSKALSENLITDEINNLPIIIFRPSVVVPVWREPLPGYGDDNMELLIGAAGKGLIKTLYCKNDANLDYIPGDILANTLMFSVFDFITNNGQRRVYNAVSSNKHKITFSQVVNIGQNIIETSVPLNFVWWYPGVSLTQSKFKHYICLGLLHLIDVILILLRKKPILVDIQRQASQQCEFYVNRNWNFNNSDSLKAIENNLNPCERKTYKMDVSGINFRDYFKSCIHFMKETKTDDQIYKAKKQMKIMQCLDQLVRVVFFTLAIYYTFIIFGY